MQKEDKNKYLVACIKTKPLWIKVLNRLKLPKRIADFIKLFWGKIWIRLGKKKKIDEIWLRKIYNILFWKKWSSFQFCVHVSPNHIKVDAILFPNFSEG